MAEVQLKQLSSVDRSPSTISRSNHYLEPTGKVADNHNLVNEKKVSANNSGRVIDFCRLQNLHKIFQMLDFHMIHQNNFVPFI